MANLTEITQEAEKENEQASVSRTVRQSARLKVLSGIIKLVSWMVFGLAFLALAILSYQYPEVTGDGWFWEGLFTLLALASFRVVYVFISKKYR